MMPMASLLYCQRLKLTPARRASEGANLLPRLRFVLEWNEQKRHGSLAGRSQ